MKNFKEMLKGMTDKAIEKLAVEIWEAYEDDGEDGIGGYLDVDVAEASKMLECSTLDEFLSPADLADAMKVYKAGGSEEAYLRAELRRIRAREAEIRARLKELETAGEPVDISPVGIFCRDGAEALAERLDGLDGAQLWEVIKANRLDPFRMLKKTMPVAKLRSHILERAEELATQGDVFRNYAY